MLLRIGAITETGKNRNKKHIKGFTLSEVLITVAILLILLALVIPNLIKLQRTLRQKELDAKAEIIYMAAQERLVALHSSGNSYTEGPNMADASGGQYPNDMIVTYDDDGNQVHRAFKYITSVSPASSKTVVLPVDVIDEELRSNNWVIEYDPTNDMVYAVYYSEKKQVQDEYPSSWSHYDTLRDKQERIKDGAWIGYYGGDAAAMGGEGSSFAPTITIKNTEELTVKLQCNAFGGIKDMVFELTMKDESGHVYKQTFSNQITQLGRSFVYEMTLDSLKENSQRFNVQYGTLSGHLENEILVPGQKLTLELKAYSKNNAQFEPGTATAETNSLFAQETVSGANDPAGTNNGVAYIAYGRHLQNLDQSSGVTSTITKAQQMYDITFSDDPDNAKDWYSTYSKTFFNGLVAARETANFKPIVNDNLKTYDGTGKLIQSLCISVTGNVDGSGNAGLFKRMSGGMKINNVYLTAPYVRAANGSAGGFAGSVSGNGNEFNNAGVFLMRNDINNIQGSKDKFYWITGEEAGGLVGKMSGGSLSVNESFASTVIKAENHAAGLIGCLTGGSLYIDKSYADNYIEGKDTAGLVCTDGETVNAIRDCYSAGFQTGSSSEAGLVNGDAGTVRRTYTIVAKKSEEKDNAKYYSTAESINTADRVYYLTASNLADNLSGTSGIGSMTKSALRNQLGDAFEVDTSDAFLYNLMNQGLTGFDYPCLTVNRHYGDWKAAFSDGYLVYYELYDDGSYGFCGANIRSTLKTSGIVVGDGYGLVYKGTGGVPGVWINGDRFHTEDITPYPVRSGSATYYIYPFDKQTVNTAPSGGKFYKKIVIHTDVEDAEDETFYYNPLFAKTVVHADTEPPEESLEISIRTPRHLYNMSLHYDDKYRSITGSTYKQERSLDYSSYKWTRFFTTNKMISSQEPIGATSGKSFRAVYDGGKYTISNVSIISFDGEYVGLFGYNTGSLLNIALVADYDPDASKHFIVQRKSSVSSNQTVHLGVLAGYNAGAINNCATAGYYIAGIDGTIHAYSNSTVYAGGLVGTNTKSIRNSSADCPEIRASALYATVAMGGFAGRNTGDGIISNCYALGYVEVAEAKGGNVAAAGFAGSNLGSVSNSYCATAVRTSGDSSSYGFSPFGGVVSGCTYLNQGTYTYINDLYIYSFDANLTTGSPVKYKGLKDAASTKATAKHTYYHPNTYEGASYAYPFRAVVRDSSGSYAHYGDWLTEAELGVRGIIYWEIEEEGSNNGCHFTYLGVTEEGKKVTGTTLCNAHDDGGKITKYGYGYYTYGSPSASVTLTGLATSGQTINASVKSQLNDQLPSYTFYPYTTRTEADAGADTGADRSYISLTGDERRTGDLRLHVNGISTDVTYCLTPFFANAMQMKNAGGSIKLISSDYRVTDFSMEPGSSGSGGSNVYETRSVDQFRYINWNYETQDCKQLVYGTKSATGNYKQFPFLQYATRVTAGVMDRASVEAIRPPQFWVQSHDLLGNDGDNLTPVAGMATSTGLNGGSYENNLYTWFGGSYDGQNYKIQNIEIKSPSFTVGLFGATAGADIKNVILFSNSDPVKQIKRETDNAATRYFTWGSKTIDFYSETGAYNIGGLIGIAYEYKSANITSKISNCAIAGYEVVDGSTNRQGSGTANVGGLIGLANLNLERSSAVVDIIIDCMHPNGHAYYGSFVRVGGLAGSAGAPKIGNEQAQLAIRNCYTGGSIDVTSRCVNEEPYALVYNKGYILRDKSGTGYINSIFTAGVVGGSYAPNISNFTGVTANQPDGVANIKNCYTYMELPDLGGTVRGVSLIVSPGDRYCRDTKLNVENCWYLNSIAENIGYPKRDDPSTWPKYYVYPNANLPVDKVYTNDEYQQMLDGNQELIEKYNKLIISDEEFQKMLLGNLTCLRKYLYSQGDPNKNAPTESEFHDIDYSGLSGAAMPGRLDPNAWSKVTTVDYGGADVSGKYSFSSLDSQIGKDYPFPTVIKQKDLTFSTKSSTVDVNVHYGRWPFDGWYWEKGRDSMDIFADMNFSGTHKDYATKDFYLYYNSDQADVDFDYSEDGIAEVVSCVKEESKGRYKVTVMALDTGAVTIYESHNRVSFVLNVTAKLTLSSDPGELLLYKGIEKDLTLNAVSTESDGVAPYSDKGVWHLSSDLNTESESVIGWEQGSAVNKWKITSVDAGKGTIEADFVYNYNGKEKKSSFAVPVRALGYIGLYNNYPSTDDKSYDGYWRWTGTKTGPAGVSMPDGAELFLFGSSADGDFSSFNIDSITINDGTPAPVNKTVSEIAGSQDNKVTIGDYTLEFLETGTSGKLSILPVYVRYTGSGDPGAVKVKFSITDALEVSGSSRSYDLTADSVAVPKNVASFSKGAEDAQGTMYERGLTGNTYTVPSCGFTRPGYTFTYWKVEGDSTEYPAGSIVSNVSEKLIGNKLKLTANWKANEYRIDFDANTGTGEIPSITLGYEDIKELPKVNVEPPAEPPIEKEGFVFTGWNTADDGSGESYADGATVQRLTTGESITLYAQWIKEGNELTLMSGDATVWNGVPEGSSLEGLGYVAPESPVQGWILDGWYTTDDPATADKILDIDGEIVAEAYNIEGYTKNGEFKLSENQTLYAVWRRQGYVPVDSLGDADDGTYVIAAGSDIIDDLPTLGSNGANIASRTAKVEEGDVFDADRHTYQQFILNPDERSLWQFTYDSVTSAANNTDYYWVVNIYNNSPEHFLENSRYLKQEGNGISDYKLILAKNPYYQSGLSNRTDWRYKNNRFNSLKSVADGADVYTCYDGSKWIANGSGNVYLYKETDIYSFNPK